ncbi:MAG TPA: hypothetical protein VKP65_25435 [Rhodothermales bacterium]|nr:hypothetical protein [Rhodothermales bacterium]
MPWSKLLNVQLSRGFRVGGADLMFYVWVQNLLDADNVRGVWGATGEPDDDGYLDSPGGMADYQGSGRMYYQYRTALPAHYGMPRQVRLGLRLHF